MNVVLPSSWYSGIRALRKKLESNLFLKNFCCPDEPVFTLVGFEPDNTILTLKVFLSV